MGRQETSETEYRRILWRCRRGTRELDLVLGTFARLHYAALDPEDKVLFSRLLGLQDTRLTEWLVYRQAPDEPFSALVSRILDSGTGSGGPKRGGKVP